MMLLAKSYTIKESKISEFDTENLGAEILRIESSDLKQKSGQELVSISPSRIYILLLPTTLPQHLRSREASLE